MSGEQRFSWCYCPECGSHEYQKQYGGSAGERVCLNCKQSWWPDMDYTNTVRAHLADHKKETKHESVAALNHAAAWISSQPHGENCHLGGGAPFGCNQCFCGKDAVESAIESILSKIQDGETK